MTNVTLAHAKARLSEYVERASQGEPVQITRRGRAVARLTAIARSRKPITLVDLQAVTAGMRETGEPAGDWIRTVRAGERY